MRFRAPLYPACSGQFHNFWTGFTDNRSLAFDEKGRTEDVYGRKEVVDNYQWCRRFIFCVDMVEGHGTYGG
jgi:hypothetical protein